jgi:hypothetical protein
MLSPQERHLLIGILLILLLGALVRGCRTRVTSERGAAEALPSLDGTAPPKPVTPSD